MKRTTMERAISEAKRDKWCKASCGFCIARLGNGEVTYFPAGQPPHIAGVPDREAEILGKWRWNFTRWSRTA